MAVALHTMWKDPARCSKMWGIAGSCVNWRCSAVAFHSSVASGSGAIHCCVSAVPPLTGSSIPGMQKEPALPFLKARHPTLPVALLHQCLPLFFAGVFLSLVGLEQDLLWGRAPLKAVSSSLLGGQIVSHGFLCQDTLASMCEFCRHERAKEFAFGKQKWQAACPFLHGLYLCSQLGGVKADAGDFRVSMPGVLLSRTI